MSCYRIEVGSKHLVTPSNIVGAIANEANLEAKHIGRIDIFDVTGRRVMALALSPADGGWRAAVPDRSTQAWSPGVYFARPRGLAASGRSFVMLR